MDIGITIDGDDEDHPRKLLVVEGDKVAWGEPLSGAELLRLTQVGDPIINALCLMASEIARLRHEVNALRCDRDRDPKTNPIAGDTVTSKNMTAIVLWIDLEGEEDLGPGPLVHSRMKSVSGQVTRSTMTLASWRRWSGSESADHCWHERDHGQRRCCFCDRGASLLSVDGAVHALAHGQYSSSAGPTWREADGPLKGLPCCAQFPKDESPA